VHNTSPAYLVYSFGEGYFTQPLHEFVEVGNIIDPETDEEADLVGWSEHPVTGGNFVPRTTPMFLVYADSTGAHHFQPWQDTFTSGSLVDPGTDADMDVVGWSAEPPR
jgi:hypothetical protein